MFSWSAIISAHSRLGRHEEALKLYHSMRKSSLEADGHVYVAVSKACSGLASIVQGFVQHGHDKEALDLFQKMQEGGMEPTRVTFACVLKACSNSATFDRAWLTHFCCTKNLQSEI